MFDVLSFFLDNGLRVVFHREQETYVKMEVSMWLSRLFPKLSSKVLPNVSFFFTKVIASYLFELFNF